MNHYEHYLGYHLTPSLWESDSIEGIKQFEYDLRKIDEFASFESKKQRLGHIIEQFVFMELNNTKSVRIIAKNLQIIQDKITLGEIDCLFEQLKKMIHLEIVYKFYLYDDSFNGSEINKWIGPNRKDSLSDKLYKLKNKQLSIINHQSAKNILNALSVDHQQISSQVLFKAQLFIPYRPQENTFSIINNDCIIGYYMGINDFNKQSECEFFLLNKIDWLIQPKKDVFWQKASAFRTHLESEFNKKRSVLFWRKTKDESLDKVFVVFWL